MNVTLNKIDNVNATLTISFQEADYQADVKKELNNLSHKRPLKGFRPGHVPMALLQKFYGHEVLAQVVDRKVSRELSNYIIENKVNVLGEPMLSNDTKIDFNTQKEFDFKFELGLAPEFELTIGKDITVPYYNIEVSDEMVEKQNEQFKKRFGRQVPGEESAEDSLVKGSLAELNEDGSVKEDGVKVESTIVSPQYLKDADEKQKFVGVKVGAEVVYNPFKSVDGNLTELAALLNVDKEQAEVKSDFKFTVAEILVNQEAEMNQELFDNVLGKDVAKSEEEYLAKIREMIANQLKNDSNYRFTVDAEKVLADKVGELELPDAFLKRFLLARSKDADEKKFDEEYPRTHKQIESQLIKEKIASQFEVKVELEDKLRLARFFAAQQFAQYGMTNLPEEVVDRYAKELLEREDVSNDIQNRAFEDKLFAVLKEQVTLDEKTVSVEEFNKLFEADQQA